MDTQTRHALKQDAFVNSTATGVDWVLANRAKVIRIAAIALVVLLAVVAAIVIYQQRAHAAEQAFSNAMGTYSTPIANPAQPAPPGVKTFQDAAERGKTANPLFVDVAKRYGSTEAGENALYFAGVTAAEMGNLSQAEDDFRKAAGAHNNNTASLSKLALANLMAQAGRTADAAKLYQELIAHPTTAVPAGSAQLQLASMYQYSNPAEATRILTTLRDKEKGTAAGEIAGQRLAGNK